MATTQRTLNAKAVASIMNQRTLVPGDAFDKGDDIKLRIQGNGNTIDVTNKAGELVHSATDEDVVLQKRIFNFNATAGPSITNPRNKQFFKDALAAEKAGDAAKADELYREFLNATQLSFGILLPSAIADQLHSNSLVTVVPITVDGENGKLYTVDAKKIGIVEAKNFGNVSFDMSMFDGGDDEEEEEEVEPEIATPAPKAKGKPAKVGA